MVTKVDNSVQKTLLYEFQSVYDFIENKLALLKSNQLKPALTELKNELNNAISSLEARLKKDISRIKRNDPTDDLIDNNVRSEENKYGSLVLEKKIRTFGMFLFKYTILEETHISKEQLSTADISSF